MGDEIDELFRLTRCPMCGYTTEAVVDFDFDCEPPVGVRIESYI